MEMLQAPVTYALILLNVLVSGYAFYVDPDLSDRGEFNVDRILRRRQYYRLLTSGFLHADQLHFLFNMMTLFFFGPFVEQMMGSPAFLVLYLGSELAANLYSLLVKRHQRSYSSIGASGAVCGIVFSFCLFRPLAKIHVFLLPVGIPAVLYAVLYMAYSMYAMGSAQGERVAHEAHIGGAVAGVLLTLLLHPEALAIFLAHFQR